MKRKEEPSKANRPWKKKKKKSLCKMMCAHVQINIHILLSSEKENAIEYGMGMYTCKTGKPTNDWNRCPCPNNTKKN